MPFGSRGPKDFIGADEVQPEAFTPRSAHFLIITPHRLQQVVGAGDVALDEHTGPGDGAVHVAFRRQVHHQIRIRLLHSALHRGGMSQIHLLQLMAIARLILEMPSLHRSSSGHWRTQSRRD